PTRRLLDRASHTAGPFPQPAHGRQRVVESLERGDHLVRWDFEKLKAVDDVVAGGGDRRAAAAPARAGWRRIVGPLEDAVFLDEGQRRQLAAGARIAIGTLAGAARHD